MIIKNKFREHGINEEQLQEARRLNVMWYLNGVLGRERTSDKTKEICIKYGF